MGDAWRYATEPGKLGPMSRRTWTTHHSCLREIMIYRGTGYKTILQSELDEYIRILKTRGRVAARDWVYLQAIED
jgi:hypothetical protein